MLLNHIKISFRNIRRHKLFSFINIFGLTLSITICLAVLMIVRNQLDFDTFHPHPERTYRIITEVIDYNGGLVRWATSPLPLGPLMEEEYPFVQTSTRIYRTSFGPATANNKILDVGGSFADATFFDVFGFDLAAGNASTSLTEPWSLVLTQETAERFFGEENPVGESFFVDGMGDFTVTGVFGDDLEKSHLQFGLLASMTTIPLLNGSPIEHMNNWVLGGSFTYLLLNEDTSGESLASVLPGLSQRISSTYDLGDRAQSLTFDAQSLSVITPGEELRGDIGGGKTRSMLELIFLSGVGLVILLMACFNYTNLSIARALKQARAVGIYKVLGAGRFEIVIQFVVQATMVTVASLVLAYAFLPFIPLPPGIQEEVHAVGLDLTLIGWFLLFSIFTGVLAGALPALLISARQPVEMLKNLKSLNLIGGLKLRKFMVVIQFSLSLILIIATTVMYQQSQFAATSDFGFRTNNMINLSLQGIDPQLLRNEISGLAGVEQISGSSGRFGTFANAGISLQIERSDEPIWPVSYNVDLNLIPNLDLTLLAGSNFSDGPSENNESRIIINEQLLTLLGFNTPADAIGETVWLRDSLQVEITGVLQNFHFETKSFQIRPMVMRYSPDEFNYLNISLATSDTDNVTGQLETIWDNIAPQIPIEYHFVDQYLYDSHAHEQDVASISYYGLIALTIACLGLLGMVTYTVEIRTREVGIRKVLGAGVGRIITLLSKEFVWLLVIAALVGLPAGYLIGQEFLNSYAYHINIGFGTLFTGIAILGILGLLAIVSQTWKVARQNPVDAISAE